IKRGWDWLGVTPGAAEHVGGLIEVPDLAECLTLNKADFVRGGPRGATYLAYRKAVQEAVSRQLALWGDARDAGEPARRRAARPARAHEARPTQPTRNAPTRTARPAPASALRPQHQVRSAPGRPGAGPAGGIDRVGQRDPPGVLPRRGRPLGGLPHRARDRAGPRAALRRAGEGTRVHHRVPDELGRRARAAEGRPPAVDELRSWTPSCRLVGCRRSWRR